MKKGLSEIVYILDRSGSMNGVENDVIGGFNKFVEEQKEVPGEARMTVVIFDHEYETLWDNIDIKDIPVLTNKEYVPRGMTALLDAVGRTVNSIGLRLFETPEEERPEHVIVCIMTDGYENNSKEFNGEKVKEIVKHQQDKYGWQFIFAGANIDSFAVGSSLSIPVFNTTNFQQTSDGIKFANSYLSSSTRCYRSN